MDYIIKEKIKSEQLEEYEVLNKHNEICGLIVVCGNNIKVYYPNKDCELIYETEMFEGETLNTYKTTIIKEINSREFQV